MATANSAIQSPTWKNAAFATNGITLATEPTMSLLGCLHTTFVKGANDTGNETAG